MALINCSECGKEISNKASACPNCGNPINVIAPATQVSSNKNDSLHCPKCKSINLHIAQKGFSGGKALAGTIAVGNIGLLAGTIGSRNVDVTCLNCGHRFNPVKNLKKEKERIASEEMWRENPVGVIVIAVCSILAVFLLFVPGVSIWWSVVSFVSGIIIPLFTKKSKHN